MQSSAINRFKTVLFKSVFRSRNVNFSLRGEGVGDFLGPLFVDFLDCYILNFMNCKINRIPFSYFIFRMTVTVIIVKRINLNIAQ